MAQTKITHVEGKLLGRTTCLFRRVAVDGDTAHPAAVSPLDLPPVLVYRIEDDGRTLTDPVEVARWHLHHPDAHITVHTTHA